MIRIEGVTTFIAIAELGSISEACRRLGLSKSVVSERLAELERTLGSRLIQRTTRRLTLTEDGRTFLTRARTIAREISEAEAELAERRGELVGPLRLSAPVSLGVLHVCPALYPFLQRHPALDLTLDLDDRFVDVEADGYDAVIRHGTIRDSWLVATRLAPSRRVLVAAPAYLEKHGAPSSVKALEEHAGILYTNRIADWRFMNGGDSVSAVPRRALRVNNGLIMRDAAVSGLGITLLPTFLVHEELRRGALCAIDIGMEPEGAEIHLTHPRTQRPSAKLRAVIDHLRATFGDPPYWDAIR